MNIRLCVFSLGIISGFTSLPTMADEYQHRAEIITKISELSSGICRMEPRGFKKDLELVSILIMHLETQDARERYKLIKNQPTTEACKQALQKIIF